MRFHNAAFIAASGFGNAHAYSIPSVVPVAPSGFRHGFGIPTTSAADAGMDVATFRASLHGDDVADRRRTMEAFISPFMPETAEGSFRVTSSYHTAHNGMIHVFTQQVINGIPVMNGVGQLNLNMEGDVISHSDSFWKAKVPDRTAAKLFLDEFAATKTFLDSMKGGDGEVPVTNEPTQNAQQMWVVNGKRLQLAWVFEVDVGDFEHVLEVAVDAVSGETLQCIDLVIEEDDFTENASLAGSGRRLSQAAYRGWGIPNITPELGGSELHENPQDKAPYASPLGWHQTDVSQPAYQDTRGNNVWAQENSANDQNIPPANGYRPSSQSASDFNFDFPMDFSKDPAEGQNLDAVVTNLFLMNNIMHDLLYTYGFDEEAGNFQVNNFEHSGFGNDPVVANSLDGSGVNNANMYTPADGLSPRMRMYRWDVLRGEDRPSSLDGLVVAHEYVHGLSNRLTGGPTNPLCLSTRESGGMGEGWSDYVGLMMSIDDESEFEGSIGVGSWLVGGNGIRQYPYSTDFNVNPLTFADVNDAYGVHDIGTVWCTMLWDMSADLVREVGFNEDIYQSDDSTSHGGGNNIALQNVIDGMKLQPCSPNFVDARDAILMADRVNYGGAHECVIWNAFARRGLGLFATHNNGASESFCAPDNCNPTNEPCAETFSPTPAPYPDQELGELGVGQREGDAAGIVFLEGRTQGRTNTYGNQAPDVLVRFSLPTSGIDGGILKIHTCADVTDYDSYIWLLDGDGNLIDSNDDSSTVGFSCFTNRYASYLSFEVGNDGLRVGNEYILVVDGYASSSGAFGLTISLQNEDSPREPGPTYRPTFPPTGNDDDPREPEPTYRPTFPPTDDDDGPRDPEPTYLPTFPPTDDDDGPREPEPTHRPTFPPTGDDNDDDDNNTARVCEALNILTEELEAGEVCGSIIRLDMEYGCGAIANTGRPTFYPTSSPTVYPTSYPTSFPTRFPTAGPTTAAVATLRFRIANRQAFTTDAPLYVVLIGEGGETAPYSVGAVTARTTYNVDVVVSTPHLAPLLAVRFCLDENDSGRTRIARADFEITFGSETYYLPSSRGGLRTIRGGECVDAILAD